MKQLTTTDGLGCHLETFAIRGMGFRNLTECINSKSEKGGKAWIL